MTNYKHANTTLLMTYSHLGYNSDKTQLNLTQLLLSQVSKQRLVCAQQRDVTIGGGGFCP